MHESPKRYLILRRPQKVVPKTSVSDTLGLHSGRKTVAKNKLINKPAAFLVMNPDHLRALVWVAYYAQFKEGRGQFQTDFAPPESWGWKFREKKKRIVEKLESLKLLKKLKADRTGTQVELLRGKEQLLFNTGEVSISCGYFKIECGDAFQWALNQEQPYALHLLLTAALRSKKDDATGGWYAHIDRHKELTRPGLSESKCRTRLNDLIDCGLMSKKSPSRYWISPSTTKRLLCDYSYIPSNKTAQFTSKSHVNNVTSSDEICDAVGAESVTPPEADLAPVKTAPSTCSLPEIIPNSGETSPKKAQSSSLSYKQGDISRIKIKTPPLPPGSMGSFISFLKTHGDQCYLDATLSLECAEKLVDTFTFTRTLDLSVREMLVEIHVMRFHSIAEDPEEYLIKRRVTDPNKEKERWLSCIPGNRSEKLRIIFEYPDVFREAVQVMLDKGWLFPGMVKKECRYMFAEMHAINIWDSLTEIDSSICEQLVRMNIQTEETADPEEEGLRSFRILVETDLLDQEAEHVVLLKIISVCSPEDLSRVIPGIDSSKLSDAMSNESKMTQILSERYIPGTLKDRIKRLQKICDVYGRWRNTETAGDCLWEKDQAAPDLDLPKDFFVSVKNLLTYLDTGKDEPRWGDGTSVEKTIAKSKRPVLGGEKPFDWLYDAFEERQCPALDEILELLGKSKGTNLKSVSTYLREAIPVGENVSPTDVIRDHEYFFERILVEQLRIGTPNPTHFKNYRYAALLQTEAAERLYQHLGYHTFRYPSSVSCSRAMEALLASAGKLSCDEFRHRMLEILSRDRNFRLGNIVYAIEYSVDCADEKLSSLVSRFIKHPIVNDSSNPYDSYHKLFEKITTHPEYYKQFLEINDRVRVECRAQKYLSWNMIPDYPWLQVPKGSPTNDLIQLADEIQKHCSHHEHADSMEEHLVS